VPPQRPRINVLLRSEQSGGQIAVMDNVSPAGSPGPSLHHHGFDETFYLLEGELTFQLEDELFTRKREELAFAASQLGGNVNPENLQSSPDKIQSLPPAVHEGVVQAVSQAVGSMFRVATPIAALGFLVVLFLKEYQLGRAARRCTIGVAVPPTIFCLTKGEITCRAN
jgi:hypothetical protein